MVQAITFDFWDTLVADDSDEPRRAALGLPTKPQARLQLLVDEITQYHSQISPDQIADAFKQANAAFNDAWKVEHRTPTVTRRLQVAYDVLNIKTTPNFSDVVRKIQEMEVMFPPQFLAGVNETLEQLSKKYALGIISDTMHTTGRGIRTLLEREGILKYFDVFVFSDEVSAAKPARVVFERAAKELGVPLENIAHVGDRESNDVEGARAAGMKSILFTGIVDRGSANTRASAVCRAFSELPQAIKKLDAD
ncbi:MAG: HAD family hydrolase [Chloroflexi bacterium]|nr:HAD family hydrolase [Chloroflexota bacterium]